MPEKIKEVRTSYVIDRAHSFLLEFKINALPINPMKIILEAGWTTRTYQYYAEKHKVGIADIIKAYDSQDGFTIYDETSRMHSIAYNDKVSSKGRRRFTLMHEIAHIYLKHLIDFEQTILKRGGLTDLEYSVLEEEANLFTRMVLAPAFVLNPLNWTTYEKIKYYCGLSKAAAQRRVQELLNPEANFIPAKTLRIFHSFIHQKNCVNCNHYFVISTVKYCPVCGGKQFKWGRNKNMIYYGFDLDESGKAKICPKCTNEEINPDYGICKICGINIVNKCAGKAVYYENGYEEFQCCETIADGNARYCIKCGAKTTFFEQGLLDSWEEEKKEKEAHAAVAVLPCPPPKLVSNNPFAPKEKWEPGKF